MKIIGGRVVTVHDEVDVILAQWAAERPDIDVRPMAVVSRISRLGRHYDRLLKPPFAEAGVEPFQFDVLASLRRAGQPYRLSVGTLMRTLLVTSGAMTNRIDGLEAAGWVVRERDPADRRGVLVRLTPEGVALVDRLLAEHVANERDLLTVLDDDEFDQLAALLGRLLAAVEGQEHTQRTKEAS